MPKDKEGEQLIQLNALIRTDQFEKLVKKADKEDSSISRIVRILLDKVI